MPKYKGKLVTREIFEKFDNYCTCFLCETSSDFKRKKL